MVIRIKDLPLNGAPSASQFVATDLAAAQRLTIQGVVDTGAPVNSQAEAEAGIINTGRMTPLTTAQAIAFQAATAAQGDLADSAVQPGDLAQVATSGDYNDLLNLPSLSTELIFPVKADAAAATIPSGEGAVRTNGDVTEGDGLGGLFIDIDNGNPIAFTSSGATARPWYMASDVGKGRISSGIVPFETEAAFSAATIPAILMFVETAGYYAAGDGGGHLKKRISTPSPIEAWHKQSADGAWWEISVKEMNPHFLGAKGDLVNEDGPAIEAAIAYCKEFVTPLRFYSGDYLVTGKEFYLDFPLDISGANRETTRIFFAGTPPKTKRTRVVWKAAYDTGDYSSVSDDDAIGCGFVLDDQNIRITDLTAWAQYTALANYPLPFDSATDYPTSNYDVGFLVLKPNCILERVETVGPWGSFGFNGGLRIDDSVSGGAEHIRIHDSVFRGRWGVSLTGPLGQPTGGENFADMTSADTRGSAGWSDTVFNNVELYDTAIRLTIDGNANRMVKRYSTTGGPVYISGQIGTNSSKRQQKLVFNNCRFANIDEYTMYVNYVNRIEFNSCHTEWKSGSYLTDGVTLATSGDNLGRWITANARNILWNGGEWSGEADNQVYATATDRIVSLMGVSDGTGGRLISGLVDDLRGTWTPTVIGQTSGSATIGQEYASYVRQGNLVTIQARIQLSAVGTLTGNVQIGGLPFTAANPNVFADWHISIATSLVTIGDAGVFGLLGNGGSVIDIFKIRSAASLQNVALADIVGTSLFFISGTYITDDP